ncbi:MAG: prepilin peptidase [Rickettsiales bacterium]|nr:prepilin peptidase [Rickettsiales bacterium]
MQAFLIFNILPLWFKLLSIGVLGSIIGSFLSLVSYRIVTKEPIIFARSKCSNCGKILKALNLIPIFSWLFSSGKCGACQISISKRYPLIELTTILAFLLTFTANNYQINWIVIVQFAITANLILMCITDLEHYFIPNQSQFSLAILVTILIALQPNTDFLDNVSAAFLLLLFAFSLLGFFYITTKKQAIGIDDIKFFFIAGFAIGVDKILLFTMLSGLIGVLFGSVWKLIKKEDTFPFAPAICVALFIVILFGQKLDLLAITSYVIFGI